MLARLLDAHRWSALQVIPGHHHAHELAAVLGVVAGLPVARWADFATGSLQHRSAGPGGHRLVSSVITCEQMSAARRTASS